MAKKLIIVLGRGKSATRIPSHLLQASNVFMGRVLNVAGDKTPHNILHDAAKFTGLYVDYLGDYQWYFDRANTTPIPHAFKRLMGQYLEDIWNYQRNRDMPAGWKMPETLLTLPFLIRLYPEAYYIHWVRDPRAVIRKAHKTDDLGWFNIDAPKSDQSQETRAISWLYQWQITQAIPKPKRWLQIRFEDYVNNQGYCITKLEDFLGMKLGRVVIRDDVQTHYEGLPFPFLASAMEELGYYQGEKHTV